MLQLKSRLETLLNPDREGPPPQGFVGLIQQTALGCADVDIALHAAGLAYSTIFTIGIAGLVIGQSRGVGGLIDRMLGTATADFVQEIIGNSLSLRNSG